VTLFSNPIRLIPSRLLRIAIPCAATALLVSAAGAAPVIGTATDLADSTQRPVTLAQVPCLRFSQLVEGDSLFRTGVTPIYDRLRQRMIVFGGGARNGVRNDLWAQDLSGTWHWQCIAAQGPLPPPRYDYGACYDSTHDRILIFGGFTATNAPLNDLWELSMSGTPTWRLVVTNGAPPVPRTAPAVAYDPVRDRLIVFGGFSGHFLLNDIWELPNGTGTWSISIPTARHPCHAPAPARTTIRPATGS